MPLQNRIDPCGNFIATDARGALMGNRGVLHNDKKEITSLWKHQSWVTCQLSFKGRQRKIFSPGSYSELFFLDEATAFAAGHRPCCECRRERCQEFIEVWKVSNADLGNISSLGEIDKQLNAERAVPRSRAINGGRKAKVTYTEAFGVLPDGTFIELDDDAYLCWQGKLKKWSAHGYLETELLPEPDDVVTVLTPRSIVKMYSNGFIPQVGLAD